MAFDGTTLYYTLLADANIYRATTTGGSLAAIPLGGRTFACGALAWDPIGSQLWCGSYDGTGKVYTVNPADGAATLRFTQTFADDGCYGPGSSPYIDGLAFDPSDGTIWLSGDAARTLYHVTTAGAPIGAFPVPTLPSNEVQGCNTGIAVTPDGFLELALQTGPDQGPHVIVTVAKSAPSVVVASFVALTTNIPGIEDLEFDGVTFAPRCAVWSNRFGSQNQLTAYQIPCGAEITTAKNEAAIGIPSGLGEAGVYPSPIEIGGATTSGVAVRGVPNRRASGNGILVTGTPGLIRKLTVTLRDFTYTYAADLDILLVGPGGQTVMLMSDAGASFPLDHATLTFDDDAEVSLPTVLPIRSGTYKPTNLGTTPDFDFPAPAPPGPYGTSLAVFKGIDPRGTWQLFMRDDLTGDAGSIDKGWELNILTGPLPPIVHDLDGDGRADLALFRQSNGLWTVRRSLEGIVSTVAFGNPALGDVPVPGDYDHDGVTDLAVYRASTGEWFIRRSTDSVIFPFTFGPPQANDTPIPADYDGDGATDPALYRPATGQFFIRRSSDGAVLNLCCADPVQGDVPIPADYDGDGTTDLAIWRPTTGEFFIGRSSDSTVLRLCCGGERSDLFIPADYDGDGKADLALYRPGTGEFFIGRSSNSQVVRLCCADPNAQDAPVVADYDGDGKADIAIYRRTTGTFYIAQSSDGTLKSFSIGTPGLNDVPTIQPVRPLPLPEAPSGPPPEPTQDPPSQTPPPPPPCKPDPEGYFPTC